MRDRKYIEYIEISLSEKGCKSIPFVILCRKNLVFSLFILTKLTGTPGYTGTVRRTLPGGEAVYYEFYPDLYFIENLLMNDMILRAAGQMINRKVPVKRNAAAAAAGALGSCAVMLLPVRYNPFLACLCSFLNGCVISVYAFSGKSKTQRIQIIRTFWMAALFLGGIWQCLIRITGIGFFVWILPGYGIFTGVWHLIRNRDRKDRFLYDVFLVRRGREVRVRGLLDSGNQLVQPGSGRPVQIIERKAVEPLLDEQELAELEGMLHMRAEGNGTGVFTYIPYRSIGREHGIMPVLELDSLRIKHGESAWNTGKILAAVSENAVSSRGEYQMILHPQILE